MLHSSITYVVNRTTENIEWNGNLDKFDKGLIYDYMMILLAHKNSSDSYMSKGFFMIVGI